MRENNYSRLPLSRKKRKIPHLFIFIMMIASLWSAAPGAWADQFSDIKLPALSLPSVAGRGEGGVKQAQKDKLQQNAEPAEKRNWVSNAYAGLHLLSLRLTDEDSGQDEFSLVAVFDRRPDFSLLALDKPPRLVVNLPASQFDFNLDSVDKRNRLAGLRYGASGRAGSRLIFELKQPFRVISVHSESLSSSAGEAGWQITIKLAETDEKAFRQYLQKQNIAGELTPQAKIEPKGKGQGDKIKAAAAENQSADNRSFIVAIDPGHGDFDSGAVSADGIKEKNVTLAFAKILYQSLLRKQDIKPYLTRSSDEYLKLDARTDKARAAGASLFISIHADHIDSPALHGATVYTLSDKASDAMAKNLADYENKSDLLGGASVTEAPVVSDILMEMAQRETRRFSEIFASSLVKNLSKGGIALMKNPHRSANFQVLRVADIPSVLVEIGYLSNRQDEENITNPAWQKKMADIMADSIAAYARSHRQGQ